MPIFLIVLPFWTYPEIKIVIPPPNKNVRENQFLVTCFAGSLWIPACAGMTKMLLIF